MEPSHVADENVKWCSKLWKTVWQLLKKLNIDTPYDLEVLVLRIGPPKKKQVFEEKFVYICSNKHYS